MKTILSLIALATLISCQSAEERAAFRAQATKDSLTSVIQLQLINSAKRNAEMTKSIEDSIAAAEAEMAEQEAVSAQAIADSIAAVEAKNK